DTERADLPDRFEDAHLDAARLQLERRRQSADAGTDHESAHHPLLLVGDRRARDLRGAESHAILGNARFERISGKADRITDETVRGSSASQQPTSASTLRHRLWRIGR